MDNEKQLSRNGFLAALCYYDVFQYPLTLEEASLFSPNNIQAGVAKIIADELILEKRIFLFGDFYSLRNDPLILEKRLAGNKLAIPEIQKAKKIAQFLSWFPYMKCICISGSLSKDFAYKGSDVDFFIITKSNRLWLSRFFFTLFLKPATLLGYRNWFCLNYFVDEDSLEIEEKNIYTATEIATLLPLYGESVYERFMDENKWYRQFLPNFFKRQKTPLFNKIIFLRKMIEWMFNNRLGDFLEAKIFHFYRNRWHNLWLKNKYTKTGFRLGNYIAAKHVCKPCPENFQEKILLRIEYNINKYTTSPSINS